jgi:hypothetical protein
MSKHFANPEAIYEFVKENFERVADYMGVRHWQTVIYREDLSDRLIADGNRACMIVEPSPSYEVVVIRVDVDALYKENETPERIIKSLEHEYIHALISPMRTYRTFVENAYIPEGDAISATSMLWVESEERTVVAIERMIRALRNHCKEIPPTSSEIPKN